MTKSNNCKICAEPLNGKQKMFCSTKCKNHAHQSYDAQKKRGLARKIALITQKGAKCTRCGYNKNLSALSFHHLDSKTKSFKLDARSLSNRTMKSVMEEFNKCLLLCNNCHSEIHNPDLDLGKLTLSRLL